MPRPMSDHMADDARTQATHTAASSSSSARASAPAAANDRRPRRDGGPGPGTDPNGFDPGPRDYDATAEALGFVAAAPPRWRADIALPPDPAAPVRNLRSR